ncbi:hypothetical protein GCM10009753_24570 [Streptantibioticus ferralitis]
MTVITWGSLIVTRSTLPIAVALSTAAALLLSACGGGSPSKPSGKIAGAQSNSPTAASPSSAAPKGAPEIKLPSDVKVEIEDPSGDPATAEPSADLQYAIRALREGYAQGNGQVPSMLYAYGPDAGIYWSQLIKKFRDQDKTITGTYRYYSMKVKLTSGSTAAGSYCEDQRQAFAKDIKTGKVYKTTPSNDDFFLNTVKLTKDQGVWKVAEASWKKGDSSCVRG